MKRKPIILALAPLLVVGAALWGVNYRLDHPPLTKADREFRALVAGADSLEVRQLICLQANCSTYDHFKFRPLNAVQARGLVEQLRLVDSSLARSGIPSDRFHLRFLRRDKVLARFVLYQTISSSQLSTRVDDKPPNAMNVTMNVTYSNHNLNPRFEKSLRRYLKNQVLPQRIRP